MDDALRQPVRSRADVDALLNATTNYEQKLPRSLEPRTFDLSRSEALLEHLGHPERGLPTVHVAGSKGKGTVVRLVAGALTALGGEGPVGMYTSPHLMDLSERIALDGIPVGEPALVAAAEAVRPHLRERLGTPEAPTFFEIFTAMAWHVFRAAGCRAVVLETGLGGRLDATTVCEPSATVITHIELEHTHLLGDTLEAIAGEKAGILKPGVPAFTTAQGVAREVIARRAAELGAPLTALDPSPEATTGPARRLTVPAEGGLPALEAHLAGVHHAGNLRAAAHALQTLGCTPEAVRRGLAAVELPALLEPVAREPLVLIDGAHTLASVDATLEALATCWPERAPTLIVGLMDLKNLDAMAERMARSATTAVATQVSSPRARPASEVASALQAAGIAEVHVADEPTAALAQARAVTGTGGLVLSIGSVYLAGDIRRATLATRVVLE